MGLKCFIFPWGEQARYLNALRLIIHVHQRPYARRAGGRALRGLPQGVGRLQHKGAGLDDLNLFSFIVCIIDDDDTKMLSSVGWGWGVSA